MVTLRLSLANLKKRKSAAVTLIVFILLATTLLNIGITFMSKTERIFEQKEEELNGAQFIAMSNVNTYKKDLEEFVFSDNRIAIAEKEEVIYMPTTKNNRNSLELAAVFFNLDASRKIAPLIPIEKASDISEDEAIYVPLMLKSYNLSVGDTYDITYKGKTYSFVVAGFFESTYFSTSSSGYLKYFIPKEGYERLFSEIGRAVFLSARFKGTEEGIDRVSEEFTQEFSDMANLLSVSEKAVISYLSSASMKSAFMSFISVGAVILIAFSLVICVIIMSVIYNRVVESIDESMQNIGVLGAIGYTTKQIMTSIVLEYLLVCMIGYIGGVLLTYAIDPVLSNYLSFTGIILTAGMHLAEDVLCLCIMLCSIGITAFLGTMRITKLPPVKALHKVGSTHRFKKNMCPLHKGIGSIHVRLGMKTIFTNLKSNLSFSLIVAGGMFAIGLSMVTYLNFAVDTSALFKMSGFEMSDLQVSVTSHTDVRELAAELSAMEGVRKTNLSGLTTAKLESNDVDVIVSDNFEAMETLSTYDGTLPHFDNEIAITGVMSKTFQKEIGDTIMVTSAGRTSQYYVTGIFQTSNNNGNMCILPLDALKKLRPQYDIEQIDIYLKEDMDKELFKEKLRKNYKVAVNDVELLSLEDNNSNENAKYTKAAIIAEQKISKLLADYGVNSVSYSVLLDGNIILSGDSSAYKIDEIKDLKDYTSGQLDTLGSILSGLVTVIVVITFLVIGGILSITIKSLIRKKREEYGIYKAMGYTTKDLIKQLSINFMLTSFLGSAVGSLATILFSNTILQLLFVHIGFTRLTLTVNIGAVLILNGFMMIFIYVMALTKAYKIKTITAYDLLTE
ncbi:ABC transporter permease [Anaerocolumna cellulosilytica]|nr:ABC transporter permease [Anaerocolumna cellulosilytica]